MKRVHSVDTLFALLLFSLFLVLSLLLLAIGGDVSKTVSDRAEQNSEARIALSYVSNKVRGTGQPGGCRIEERNGGTALILPEQVGKDVYETVIYFDSGALKEVYLKRGADFIPAAGSVILDAQGFRAQESGGMLHISIIGKSGRVYTQQLVSGVAA